MGDVVQFVRPLAWTLDLDLRADEARIVAEFLSQLPKRTLTYAALARVVALHLQWLEGESAQSQVARESFYTRLRAERERVLPALVERCDRLEGAVSLAGAALVARQPRDEQTVIALRRLTRDARVLERLGLSSDAQAWP